MLAVIVCGPESSGNRLLTSLLVQAGCKGCGHTSQPFDGPGFSLALPKDLPKKLVYFRSLPHGGVWIDLAADIGKLRSAGYNVSVLVTCRDQRAQELSQQQTHERTASEYRANYRKAYLHAFSAIIATEAEYLMVPYSSLGRQSYRNWLCGQLGLPTGMMTLPFLDGDQKYWPP